MQIYKGKDKRTVGFRTNFRLNTARQRYWLASVLIESNYEMYLQSGLVRQVERDVYPEAY